MLNSWQPSCNREALRARAAMLEDIRGFFKERDVLEVETPLLCKHAATDLHIQAIPAYYSSDFSFLYTPTHVSTDASTHASASTLFQRREIPPNSPLERGDFFKPHYLQTSPEFAMKRLLAAGSGSIYQLCKAFRNAERGHRHNPEFSILEWYRLGFDHHQLMDEMDEFLQEILGAEPALRFSYQELFMQYLNIEPHTASITSLQTLALEQGIHIAKNEAIVLSKDDWLDLLMTHCIEPQLKMPELKIKHYKRGVGEPEKATKEKVLQKSALIPVIIYDYPATQAALAKVRPATENGPSVAERFEVYIEGVELANGYHELSDGELQLQRFQEDNEKRLARHYSSMEPDLRLVEALKAGFPSCAGVALGIDRLLMLKGSYQSIDEVLSFTIDRA